MADRIAKLSTVRRTPTPLFNLPGGSGSKMMKVRRDPPLGKLHFLPSEKLGPAFDIPELTQPKKKLPPLASMDSCDMNDDGDKEVVTLPRTSRPKERVAKPAKKEKKRFGQKQNKAMRDSTPDIDQLVRKLCGGSDLPPVAHFTTQPVLPSVLNKTTDKRPNFQENKRAVNMDKGDKAGRQKKDKRKKEKSEYQRDGEKTTVTKKKEKTKKAKMTIQSPPPPAVSPSLSQILKEVQDAAHEKRVGSSSAKMHSDDVLKHDPLMAYQNRVLAMEDTTKVNTNSANQNQVMGLKDTAKGSANSRQPLQGMLPNARQPLRGLSPNTRLPLRGLSPNACHSLQTISPYPEITRKSSPEEIDLDKEITYSFDINEEEEETLTYVQSIPFLAPTSPANVSRKPLVSKPVRLGLLPKPPAFPKPPTAKGGAQIGFRRRRYQAGVQKKQYF